MVSMDITESELEEQAYLVSRGVRPMALVGRFQAVDEDTILCMATRMEVVGSRFGVIPFVLAEHDGTASCGFTSHQWIVDTHRWLMTIQPPYSHRIMGLLLGYSAAAIENFEQRQSTIWRVKKSREPMSS